MATTRRTAPTIRPTKADVRAAKNLPLDTVKALKGARGRVRLRLPRGRGKPVDVDLPASVARMVGYTIEQVREGNPVQVTPVDEEVSPAKAAELLKVSRPHAQRLMDEGKISSRLVGTHRRALRADVEAYRDRMQRTRRAALDEAIGESRALGFGYDA